MHNLGIQIKDLYTSMSVINILFSNLRKMVGNSSKKSKKFRLRRETYEMDNETWIHKFSQ